MQHDPQSLLTSRSRLATVGFPWIAPSWFIGRPVPAHRSADFGEALAANKKAANKKLEGLAALPIPPLLWPIY